MGLSRSSWYYQPLGETAENLELMRRIDEEYTRHPFYGSRRICSDFVAPQFAKLGHLLKMLGIEELTEVIEW